ncbi:MAG: SpoIIE family protein phosphatase [Bacteroidales bacterium]|nr:SpoIIE family protein phosphatase [Bacteroidales bacterium]
MPHDNKLYQELLKQKDEISRQKKEIIESLEYARLIQTALLPQLSSIRKALHDNFILYLPKDIISGDFYWIFEQEENILFAAVDCTGHGVPGALMSILGITSLNEIVSEADDLKANRILNQLREKIMKSLHQTGRGGESKDGMDISFCIYNRKTNELQYSGANNPLYYIRQNILYEIKPDKMPIGVSGIEEKSFRNNVVKMKKGDVLYIFTDGFPDQFGGPKEKKFKYKPFKNLLLEIHNKNMKEQREILESSFSDWKMDFEQVDDVLVIGIRID